MSDLKELPYAAWLEQSLQNIVELPIRSICILTRCDDGEVETGYYECSAVDKLLFASHLQHDAVVDTVDATRTFEEDEEDEDE